MKQILYFVFAFQLSGIVGCDLLSSDSADVSGEWLIPKDQIFDGGPGKDGIPALTNPQFAAASATSYLKDNDLVILIKLNNEIKVYPHPILDWHEIINDGIGNDKFTITYCPLTGSGLAWNRVINGNETTFGVSGLLYNSNLLPYDRGSNSNWSQMKMLSVNGSLIGTQSENYHVIETSWKTVKQLYPNAKVVTTTTGHSRSYGTYPYGDYRTNHGLLIFPVSPDDNRLPRKERVLGVINNGEAKAYRFSSGKNVLIQRDNIGGNSLIILSVGSNLLTAYYEELEDGSAVSLNEAQNEGKVVMVDTDGNKYDLFGEITVGPKAGMKLKPVTSMIAYWFAWGAFYPNTSIGN